MSRSEALLNRTELIRAILAGQKEEFDLEQVSERGEDVPKGPDLRTLVMVPNNGDLADAQTVVNGYPQDLGIKGPVVDALVHENQTGGFLTEHFKTAVKVLDLFTDDRLGQQNEDAPEQAAVQRLFGCLQVER